MCVADGEDDCLVRQATNILAALAHEFAHHGIIGALVHDAFLDIAAFEVEFVEFHTLVASHLLQGFGQCIALNALELEVGLGVQNPVVHEVLPSSMACS